MPAPHPKEFRDDVVVVARRGEAVKSRWGVWSPRTRRWHTRGQFRLAIITWIERTYHRRRRQRGLGKTTPIDFETIYWPAHAA